MKILLLEPFYKRDILPLSFMKLSAFHKNGGDEVHYHRGELSFIEFNPDIVYLTTPFTWEYDSLKLSLKQALHYFKDAEIIIGGNCAGLMKEKLLKEVEGNYSIKEGTQNQIENIPPDYDLFNLDYTIGFTTRGCCNKCDWCMVWRLEPEFVENKDWENCLKPRFLDKPNKVQKIVLMDNNFLASSYEHIKSVTDRLKTYNRPVDFNQGLDIALFKDKKAEAFRGLKLQPLRFSWDSKRVQKDIIEGIDMAISLNQKDIAIYMLYNFKEKPEDIYERLKALSVYGSKVMIFMMKYQPLDAIKKGKYIGEAWNEKILANFQRLRKPFANGVLRFDDVNHFERAFGKDADTFKKSLENEEVQVLVGSSKCNQELKLNSSLNKFF